MVDIADIATNHPSLKTNIVNRLKEDESSYLEGDSQEISATVEEPIVETQKIVSASLILSMIDITIPVNQNNIRTQIINDFNQIAEQDITIDFTADTVIISVRQNILSTFTIDPDYGTTLQNILILAELEEQSVAAEGASPIESTPQQEQPVSTEKDTSTFTFTGDNVGTLDKTQIQNQVAYEYGVDVKDVSVYISTDGTNTVEVAVSYDTGTDEPSSTEIETIIETTSKDNLIGFISTGSTSASLTTVSQDPEQIETSSQETEYVSFDLSISSVEYSQLTDADKSDFNDRILDLLRTQLTEAQIDNTDIIFSSGSLKIKIILKLKSDTATTLELGIIANLESTVSAASNEIKKEFIKNEIVNLFKSSIGTRITDVLEPGKVYDDVGITIESLKINKTRSNNSSFNSKLIFNQEQVYLLADNKESIITAIKNVIESSIESASADVTINSNIINILVSSSRGIYGIGAIEASMVELKPTIELTVVILLISILQKNLLWEQAVAL